MCKSHSLIDARTHSNRETKTNIKEMNSTNYNIRKFSTYIFFILQWSPSSQFTCRCPPFSSTPLFLMRFHLLCVLAFCQFNFNFPNSSLWRDKESSAWGHNITWLDPVFFLFEKCARWQFCRKSHPFIIMKKKNSFHYACTTIEHPDERVFIWANFFLQKYFKQILRLCFELKQIISWIRGLPLFCR